ncbi:MAG: ABC transporter ATP-binding protein [Candidatus Asgardarchaeia archaeon]
MPRVLLKDVTKRYGSFTAVDRINFEVKDGEYVTLLGPSGCGKTTTLKLIAGLRKPDEGEIWIGDMLVNEIPPEDRDIGFVFQHFAIFPHMSVWDNVAYGLKLRGFDDIKIQKSVWDALELVGLIDKLQEYPRKLSAPELQRVGIARAIATGAKLLLLDEPLSLLDLKVRHVFRYELRRLVKKLKLTAIHVTHDQEEAMAISDKIIVMKKGKIMQVGHPYELYSRPKSLFVANFIGESNFFVGHITSLSKDYMCISIRGDYTLKANKSFFAKGDPVVVAIRRERFIIKQEHDNASTRENIITGKVITKRSVGFYSRLRIKLNSGDVIEIKVSPDSCKNIKENDEITLYVAPEDILVYPYPKEGLEKTISVI